MQILTGLFAHMVMQRDAQGRSAQPITGTSSVPGVVVARVTGARGKTLPGFAQKPVGKAARGQFSATLAGVPTGGPYAVTLSVTGRDGTSDTLTVEDVLVGDVWIAGGQSNMQGCGLLAFAAKALPQVRAFYMDDRWAPACDPIHNLWDAVDRVHVDISGGRQAPATITGNGPAVFFAQDMYHKTNVPQGILACGHGVTSMTQWDPARRDEGSAILYGASIRRLHKNGGRCAGVIWYQGESDANPNDAAVFTPRMKTLIAAFRRDAKSPAMPFAMVQLARFINAGVGHEWMSIREQQRLLPKLVKNVVTIPAIDLALDDGIHLGQDGPQIAGTRLAQAVRALTGADTPPIALKSVTAGRHERGYVLITCEFDHVVGQLKAAGAPLGFWCVDNDDRTNRVLRVELDGRRALLHTTVPFGEASTQLYYGFSFDPAANVRDGAGRSLPCFGPVPVGAPRALTPFVRNADISAPQPSAGKLHDLAYPRDQAGFDYAKRAHGEQFCHVHQELAALAPDDVVVYFRVDLECPENMLLAALLGYDGPLKLWVDGELLLHDPDGINPAIMDSKSVRFAACAGRHEVLIALASNHGLAWGVFLRFERVDVPKKTLAKGPTAYAMVRVIE